MDERDRRSGTHGGENEDLSPGRADGKAIEGSPYDRPLPLEVPRSGATATLPFFVSDDVGAGGAAADRVRQVVLSLVVENLMV